MRLTFALALLVALAGCDAAAPSPTLADAKKGPSDGFLVTTVDANGNASEHRQDKVAVCHYDDETATYKRLSVGAPALSAHLTRHPDGLPGGEVPEADVPSTFGDDCEVVPDVDFTCEAVYDVDASGRPTVVVTATHNDPSTTVFSLTGSLSEGPDEEFQSSVDASTIGFSDNPASATIGAYSAAAPNDDLFLLSFGVRFPDGSEESYSCDPFPVIQADAS